MTTEYKPWGPRELADAIEQTRRSSTFQGIGPHPVHLHEQYWTMICEALRAETLSETGITDDRPKRDPLTGEKVMTPFLPPEKADWIEEEMKDGDRICEAAGVERTEGGRLPVAKIVNKLRAPETISATVKLDPTYLGVSHEQDLALSHDLPPRDVVKSLKGALDAGSDKYSTPRTDALARQFPNGGMGLDKQQCITQLLEEHSKLESELASAKRDADHFFKLSGEYLERANKAEKRLSATLSPNEPRIARDEALMEAASLADSMGCDGLSERIRELMKKPLYVEGSR